MLATPVTRERQAPAITSFTVAVAAFAVLAVLAPFGDAEHPLKRVGVLLAFGGALEVLHGIRRADSAALRRAVTGGVLSLLMGLMVMSASGFAGGALVLLLAITFVVDGLGYVGAARPGARPITGSSSGPVPRPRPRAAGRQPSHAGPFWTMRVSALTV